MRQLVCRKATIFVGETRAAMVVSCSGVAVRALFALGARESQLQIIAIPTSSRSMLQSTFPYYEWSITKC